MSVQVEYSTTMDGKEWEEYDKYGLENVRCWRTEEGKEVWRKQVQHNRAEYIYPYDLREGVVRVHVVPFTSFQSQVVSHRGHLDFLKDLARYPSHLLVGCSRRQ